MNFVSDMCPFCAFLHNVQNLNTVINKVQALLSAQFAFYCRNLAFLAMFSTLVEKNASLGQPLTA